MNDKQCMKCDKECALTCRGQGPGNCDKCKHATLSTPKGPVCVAECPEGKYNDPLLGEYLIKLLPLMNILIRLKNKFNETII